MVYRILFGILFLLAAFETNGASWIRINQMGYMPQSVKVAVFISDEPVNFSKFQHVNAATKAIEYDGAVVSGLVDGPVYRDIFNGLIGFRLMKEDTYLPFQESLWIKRDDYFDSPRNPSGS